VWPELIPDVTAEQIPYLQAAGTIVGDPDHALEQCKRWEAAGADQLSFGLGMASKDESLEMVRLMGEHVIPKIDTDPVHRTTRMREAAAAKLPV
jgi:alkanesulfonate monooxygenase SsuD/methylene tetrahydromethanopterin reductase-like flavin-dependent oxidoreductase (luciferase family)